MCPLLTQRTSIPLANSHQDWKFRMQGNSVFSSSFEHDLYWIALFLFFLSGFFFPLSESVVHSKGGNIVKKKTGMQESWPRIPDFATSVPCEFELLTFLLCASAFVSVKQSQQQTGAKAGSEHTLQWLKNPHSCMSSYLSLFDLQKSYRLDLIQGKTKSRLIQSCLSHFVTKE